jgi:hypothetical protein
MMRLRSMLHFLSQPNFLMAHHPSPEADPRFETIQKVCKAFGVKLTATTV